MAENSQKILPFGCFSTDISGICTICFYSAFVLQKLVDFSDALIPTKITARRSVCFSYDIVEVKLNAQKFRKNYIALLCRFYDIFLAAARNEF